MKGKVKFTETKVTNSLLYLEIKRISITAMEAMITTIDGKQYQVFRKPPIDKLNFSFDIRIDQNEIIFGQNAEATLYDVFKNERK